MTYHHRSSMYGFGLIEAMIAILVLSVGLLGMAGLHMTGLKSTHSAYYRTQATIASYEILDRMRANAEAARDEAYDATISDGTLSLPQKDTTADADLTAWQKSLDVLPSFSGIVDCASDGDCEVVVQWDDSRADFVMDTTVGGGGGTTPTDNSGGSTSTKQVAKFEFRVRTRI